VDQIVPAQLDAPQPPEAFASASGALHRKYALILALGVLLAFGPLLLANQWLWDDWVIIGHARLGDLWDFFGELGRRDQFMMVQPLASYGSARDCTAVVLLLSAAIGPLVYEVIRRATTWSPADAFWAALLTSLAPLNQARFVLSASPYAFSSLFFVLALVLLLRDLERPSRAKRLLSLLLLIMAFSTNSFLVLAWIAPLLVLRDGWLRSDGGATRTDRARFALWSLAARGELLVAPPAYWLAKKMLMPVHGLYAQYNTFKMDALAALGATVTTLFDQVGKDAAANLLPRRYDLVEIAVAVALIVALFAAIVRVWHLPLRSRDAQRRKPQALEPWIAVIAAGALCISALFPYVIVGSPPHYLGLWETRHQTTLALVSGFTVVAIYRLVFAHRFVATAAAVTAIVFLTMDLSVTHRLLADILETGEIADGLRRDGPTPGTMMYVVENDRTYRLFGRYFPFYELAGLARSDRAGEPVLAQSNQEFIDPASGYYAEQVNPRALARLRQLCNAGRNSPQFGFEGFVSNGQIQTVDLTAARPRPGPLETLSLAIRQTGRARPDPGVAPLVRIDRKTSPIAGACHAPCCDG
jgi:hypothetical protein